MAKPTKPTTFDSTQLSPAFKSIFDKAFMVVPIWEGAGTAVRDLVSGEDGVIVNTQADANGPKWGSDAEGAYLEWVSGTGAQRSIDFGSTSRATPEMGDFTIVFIGDLTDDLTDERTMFAFAGYVHLQVTESTAGAVQITCLSNAIAGGAGAISAATVNDSLTHISQARRSGSTVGIRVDDGAWAEDTGEPTNTFIPASGPTIGCRGDGAGENWVGKVRAVYFFLNGLSDTELDAIVADPYGLVRMQAPASPVTVTMDAVGTVIAGNDALLSASASSTSGAITGVSFFNASDDTVVGAGVFNAGTGKWEYTLASPAAGPYSIYAQATDGTNTGDSADVSFNVTALSVVGTTMDSSHDAISVACQLNVNATDVRLNVYSDSGRTNLVAQSPAGIDTTNADYLRFARLDVSGLSANTTYYLRIEAAGIECETYDFQITTLPAPGTPVNLDIGFSNCADTASNHEVFSRILARSFDRFIYLGDFHYIDSQSTDPVTYLSGYAQQLAQSNQKALWKTLPILYQPDDHSWPDNDANGTMAGMPAAQEAGRRALPWIGIPSPASATGAVYYSRRMGRVRVIVPDTRSEREVTTGQMLSTTQMTWLKGEITDAAAAGEIIIFVAGVPWITEANASADDWSGYAAERLEIADHIISEGMSGRCIILCGDMHGLAADDGTNNTYGTSEALGCPVLIGGALDRTGSTKGGPYNLASDPGNGHYARLVVTDAGADTISVQAIGYDETDAEGFNFTTVMSVPAVVAPAIEGTVTLEGTPVSSARVYLIDTATHAVVATTTTDANGDYSFSEVNAGTYDLFYRYVDGANEYAQGALAEVVA